MKQHTMTIIGRVYPGAADVVAAKKIYEEFSRSINKEFPEVKFELLCAVEGNMVWIETWKSRSELNAYYDGSVGLTDFPARFMQVSKKPPERIHLQAVGMAIK